MKKIIAIVLALAFVLSLAACGESQTTATSISVCLASEPDTIDPALNSAVDGATFLAHLFYHRRHIATYRVIVLLCPALHCDEGKHHS